MQASLFEPGGYRYVPGVFQYSGGVAAQPGFALERVRLKARLPLAEGFALVESHLRSRGRPLTAFCACELRSPAPFDEAGFTRFNELYVGTLGRWGVYASGVNPVARSNVCPEIDPPASPSLYAFTYTVPQPGSAGDDFQISGSGEAPEGKGNYRDHIVSLGDRSAGGLRAKARWVLGELERRMQILGTTWEAASVTQLYTVYDVYPLIGEEIVSRGAAAGGLTWHFCRPPVVDLDYEMDVRGLHSERFV